MFTQIGELAEQIPVVRPETKCDIVNRLFKLNPFLEGVAVLGDDPVPSLIMRSRFFQQMGTQYGYNLYMGRPVELIMNSQPLVVDYLEDITSVSIRAMNRTEEELYDLVLITSEGSLVGAVSIRRLLLAAADVRTEMAIFMNPLTGLPGNRIIEDRLQQSSQLDRFSVLYIDLDHFKSYNDSYGFKMGDQLIQATASLLRSYFSFPDAFIGHIGGDDFIAILNSHDFRSCCDEVIAGFEEIKMQFYNQKDLDNNFVMGEDRAGQHRPIPLVSVSIAVVTNRDQEYKDIDHIVSEATRIKKRCKSVRGSIICTNEAALI
ncbi:GGDEF domain-containing protein [Paenibacillus sp. JX-17]|uniref:GGDEF domain-containing protein n=1 Tax=Paenibacillus lacisoli TaxID=3064525 RepID=A0ABT9CE45_9BACL|nr:GGDEF domain-containing protein [Paenibacillus sp. JX-17]MDO7907486.1 GGDEF domain-containing protein [Paenibacillus sp. JX-17]